jgi:hypothetical protein
MSVIEMRIAHVVHFDPAIIERLDKLISVLQERREQRDLAKTINQSTDSLQTAVGGVTKPPGG